jgi:hypothetical protein
LFDFKAGACAVEFKPAAGEVELFADSALSVAGVGWAFHNHPKPLDAADEKATAATSTMLATSSGVIVRINFVYFEFFRFRRVGRERFSLRGIENSFVCRCLTLDGITEIDSKKSNLMEGFRILRGTETFRVLDFVQNGHAPYESS